MRTASSNNSLQKLHI